jgi:hypothetical protein
MNACSKSKLDITTNWRTTNNLKRIITEHILSEIKSQFTSLIQLVLDDTGKIPIYFAQPFFEQTVFSCI